jgi:hypothetical protein
LAMMHSPKPGGAWRIRADVAARPNPLVRQHPVCLSSIDHLIGMHEK